MSVLDKIIVIGKFIVNKFWWIGLLLFIYIFIIRPIIVYNENKKFKNTPCVSIAYTVGESVGKVTKIRYVYYINNVEYEGKSSSGFNFVKTKGGKYLIKYMCDNPQDALIYFDKPIKGDTIPAEYLK